MVGKALWGQWLARAASGACESTYISGPGSGRGGGMNVQSAAFPLLIQSGSSPCVCDAHTQGRFPHCPVNSLGVAFSF